MAYPSVVAGGASATVIHYGENNQVTPPPFLSPVGSSVSGNQARKQWWTDSTQ